MTNRNTQLPASQRLVRKPTFPVPRPLSTAEIRARAKAEEALEQAQACAAAGFPEAAIKFCRIGQNALFGFSRPFAIWDQINDFMSKIDPDGRIRHALVERTGI